MAVDTRDKRASILGLGLASLLVLPAPGSIDQPDRQHVAYCYRGIAASAPIVITGDEVTTEDAVFARVTSAMDAAFARVATGTEGVFARVRTAEDTER